MKPAESHERGSILMKKNILRVLSLVLVAAMVFAFAACTTNLNIRFVDKDGNDIAIGSFNPGTPATEAPTADQPSTEAPTTAAPATEAPATDAPTTESPATGTPATEAPATDAPATEAPATDAPATEAPATEAPATEAPATEPAGPAVPTTKDEIIAFYAKAVNDIAQNGTAGYNKKEFQTMGELNITGIGMVDNAIKGVAANYFKGEDQVETQVCAKGSDDAKNRMLDWGLTDNSKVKSATYDASTGALTIVMEDEDTPHKGGGSHLDQIGSVLLWEDIDAELQGVSILSNYENVHVKYTNYTITATISADGKISALKHHTDVAIEIGSAKILFATLKDKNVTLENTVVYSDFQY